LRDSDRLKAVELQPLPVMLAPPAGKLHRFDSSIAGRHGGDDGGESEMAIRLLIAVTVALLGPLGAVATAQADTNDNKFLAALKSEGITDHISPNHAIEAGHVVCDKLDQGRTPDQVAADVIQSSNMPAYHAGYFVGVSIKEYCPQYTPKKGGEGGNS